MLGKPTSPSTSRRHVEVNATSWCWVILPTRRGVLASVGDAFCCAFSTATDALEAALSAQQELFAEEWGELYGLGRLAIDQDDPERAVKQLEESLVLAREVYAGIVPHILVSLGDTVLIQGDNERAFRVYKEALAMCRETGQELTDTGVLEGMA